MSREAAVSGPTDPTVIERWIEVYEVHHKKVAAVFYSSTDTSSTEMKWSQHKGPWAVQRCKDWAIDQGFGELEIRVTVDDGFPIG